MAAASLPLQAQNSSQREIAITIDDLPAAGGNSMTGTEIIEMTSKLLGTLRGQKVPAVGFVNERKLYKFSRSMTASKRSACGWITDSNSATIPLVTLR
jgi:hypothetical protein